MLKDYNYIVRVDCKKHAIGQNFFLRGWKWPSLSPNTKLLGTVLQLRNPRIALDIHAVCCMTSLLSDSMTSLLSAPRVRVFVLTILPLKKGWPCDQSSHPTRSSVSMLLKEKLHSTLSCKKSSSKWPEHRKKDWQLHYMWFWEEHKVVKLIVLSGVLSGRRGLMETFIWVTFLTDKEMMFEGLFW